MVSIQPQTSCNAALKPPFEVLSFHYVEFKHYSHTFNTAVPRGSCCFVHTVFLIAQLPHDFAAEGLHLADLLYAETLPPRVNGLFGVPGRDKEGSIRGIALSVRHVERKLVQCGRSGDVGEAVKSLQLLHGTHHQVLVADSHVVPLQPRGRVHYQQHVIEPVVADELHGTGHVALGAVDSVGHQQTLVLVVLLFTPQHLDVHE